MTTTHCPYMQNQLPTVSTLGINHDSFFSDLLAEFDKKHSRLCTGMDRESTSTSSSSEYDLANNSVSMATLDQEGNNVADHGDIRRQSAYQLLERSSTCLRAKFKSSNPVIQQDKDISSTPPPELQHRSLLRSWSKSLRQKRLDQKQGDDQSLSHLKRPQHQQDPWSSPLAQPLIIAQYPLPPLKYGPVEPASDISLSTVCTTNLTQAVPLPVKETHDLGLKSALTRIALELTYCFSCTRTRMDHIKLA